MKKYLLIITLMTGTFAFAQTPEDALRFSWYPQNGTARIMAIGGAMASLGGDLTATFVNPAGLGLYRTGDAVFTPGFFVNNNRSLYRDSNTSIKYNQLAFGPSGVILGAGFNKNSNKSAAISFAITQTADFRNKLEYKALNNYSSFSETFVEELVGSGRSIDEVLNVNSPLPYGAAPALYNYLIDTVRINGNLVVKAAPEYILDAGQALNQSYFKNTRGGMYEAAIGFGYNDGGKWLMGATLGIPLVHYDSKTIISESDTSTGTSFDFRGFDYEDRLTTTGVGGNLKLGVIYRPQEYLRFGLAVHTPSFMWLQDERTTVLTTRGRTGLLDGTVSSEEFTNGVPGENKYVQMAPWRAMISGSYVFREIENVKRQRAFITADIEYVHHKGSRFMNSNEDDGEDKSYYKALNKVVKNEYRGTFNFKVGGEIKFNTIMARLGAAYYTNPYKKEYGLKADRLLLSGGLGYRHKGFYVDLTYVHHQNRDVSFPYRLGDRANTYASVKQTQGQVVATIGAKLW